MGSVGFKDSFEPTFEKYTVDKEYHVFKTNPDGTRTFVPDGVCLLDSNFFHGSLAFTRDERHATLVHKIIYLFQLIHAWWTGRELKADPNVCHGMVILKQGRPGIKKLHPFVVAHAVWEGVRTSNCDNIQEEDVTELTIYRPVQADVRTLVIKNGERTAYVEDHKHRTRFSPSLKNPISLWNMFSSVFYNKPHQVCGRRGPPLMHVMHKTASIAADVLLGNQFLNDQGMPEPLFCTSYALQVMQGSFIEQAVQSVSEQARQKFLSDTQGHSLKRALLIEKIQRSFEKEDPSDEMAQTLFQVYTNHKLIRFDAEHPMSCYAVKVLDKCSYRLPFWDRAKQHTKF